MNTVVITGITFTQDKLDTVNGKLHQQQTMCAMVIIFLSRGNESSYNSFPTRLFVWSHQSNLC